VSRSSILPASVGPPRNPKIDILKHLFTQSVCAWPQPCLAPAFADLEFEWEWEWVAGGA